MNLLPNGVQKWKQKRCPNHQKQMPKLVMEKIMKTIKKHVSLNGKIIEIHFKNKRF